MRKYCVPFLAILLVGCEGYVGTGGENAGPHFSSSSDIQVALGKAGYPCLDFKSLSNEEQDLAEMGGSSDVGRCELEGDTIHLITFQDKGQLDSWTSITKQMGCTMGPALGITDYNHVRGANWAVSGLSRAAAEKLSENFGGKAVHIDCAGRADVKTPGAKTQPVN